MKKSNYLEKIIKKVFQFKKTFYLCSPVLKEVNKKINYEMGEKKDFFSKNLFEIKK